MRILWISPFPPDPDAPHAGGRAIYQWLSALAGRHEITLVCRVQGTELASVERLRGLCRQVHGLRFDRPPDGPLSTLRIAASYARLGRLANRLARTSHFDLLHVEYIEAGVGVAGNLGIPSILVALDESAKPARRRLDLARGVSARVAAYLYWRGIRLLERRICRKFDHVLAVSEHDRRLFLDLDPRLRVAVLPLPPGIDSSRLTGGRRDPDHLLFVGAMYRDTNVDAMRYFCGEILPRIRHQVPQVRLSIVGHQPPAPIRELAADPAIEVTGFVPQLEPFYGRATVFVSPVRVGGGILLKNVDAMAAGCPVVTTTIGNEGIAATPRIHLLTADDPATFATATVNLLTDEAERQRLSDNAREFVRAHFSLEATVDRLEEAYREACAV